MLRKGLRASTRERHVDRRHGDQVFIFIATSMVSGWLKQYGARNVFNTLAAVNLIISAFSEIRNRSWPACR